jgi:hypothetical protein
VPPAFAGPITEIDGRYATIMPAQSSPGQKTFTLSDGMLDNPFSGATNLQMFDLNLFPMITINGMDPTQGTKSVFDLGGTMYDGTDKTRIFDIVGTGMAIGQTEIKVPIAFRVAAESTDFQGYDISALVFGDLIFDFTGFTIGNDGVVSYDSNNPNFSATFRIVQQGVPEPTSLALVIPGLISLLGVRYLGRRRSQAG